MFDSILLLPITIAIDGVAYIVNLPIVGNVTEWTNDDRREVTFTAHRVLTISKIYPSILISSY
jgi:hypothetical protein